MSAREALFLVSQGGDEGCFPSVAGSTDWS